MTDTTAKHTPTDSRSLAVLSGTPRKIMCDDCNEPLGEIFCGDMDGRYFHRGNCGGADYAYRMSLISGTPEYLRKVESELELMKTACIVEVAVRNPQIADYISHWEGRATEAERERDALKEALREVHVFLVGHIAYLETCSTEVIVDNLPSIIAYAKQKSELAEKALEAGRTK